MAEYGYYEVATAEEEAKFEQLVSSANAEDHIAAFQMLENVNFELTEEKWRTFCKLIIENLSIRDVGHLLHEFISCTALYDYDFVREEDQHENNAMVVEE